MSDPRVSIAAVRRKRLSDPVRRRQALSSREAASGADCLSSLVASGLREASQTQPSAARDTAERRLAQSCLSPRTRASTEWRLRGSHQTRQAARDVKS